MDDQKQAEYIKTSLDQGKTKEEIYKELLAQGLSIEDIQAGFAFKSHEQQKEDTSEKTIRMIVTIGAVFVGVGIFSFIAANWQEMSRPIKIGIIIFSLLVSYSMGWYFKEKAKLLKTGEAFILLGTIIYGAGVFLVAQMFNIRANWPDGFILWMIGTVAMAFASEFYLLFPLAVVFGFIASAFHPFITFNFGYNPFLLTSSFLLLAATIITFVTALIIRKKMSPELKEIY